MKKVRFQINELLPIGMVFIVLGIALTYGLQVMGEADDDMTALSYEANASTDAIAAVAKIPAKLGTIVTVVIAALLIGILVRYLYVRFN